MGGWLSSFLLHRGWSVNMARKTAMLICACLVLPILSVTYLTNVWLAVVIIVSPPPLTRDGRRISSPSLRTPPRDQRSVRWSASVE